MYLKFTESDCVGDFTALAPVTTPPPLPQSNNSANSPDPWTWKSIICSHFLSGPLGLTHFSGGLIWSSSLWGCSGFTFLGLSSLFRASKSILSMSPSSVSLEEPLQNKICPRLESYLIVFQSLINHHRHLGVVYLKSTMRWNPLESSISRWKMQEISREVMGNIFFNVLRSPSEVLSRTEMFRGLDLGLSPICVFVWS